MYIYIYIIYVFNRKPQTPLNPQELARLLAQDASPSAASSVPADAAAAAPDAGFLLRDLT